MDESAQSDRARPRAGPARGARPRAGQRPAGAQSVRYTPGSSRACAHTGAPAIFTVAADSARR